MTVARWVFRLADNSNPASVSSGLRQRRFRRFRALLGEMHRGVRILDIGGTQEFWMRYRSELPEMAKVTLLNLNICEKLHLPDIVHVIGDARNMRMFADSQFDLCFSNSVIEHVGDFNDQFSMAQEVRRVGKGYFVQTPNIYFPIEPHFLIIGWQFAPVALRARLLQRGDLGWMKRVTDPLLAREVVESIHLLSYRKLRRLFPDGNIYRERIGPLTKSFVAWRPIC